MPVAGETCFKPDETPGMRLKGTALLAAGFHSLGRTFLPLAGQKPLAWDPIWGTGMGQGRCSTEAKLVAWACHPT